MLELIRLNLRGGYSMTKALRLVAEYYDVTTGKKIKSITLREDCINKPTTIKDLGYLHEEQIKIIQSIQDIKLSYETQLVNQEATCPFCGNKTKANGFKKSKFHAALTDHEVKIQCRRCSCGWSPESTVDGLYGSSLHPDLIEKQVIQGVENSYRQASRQLNAESKSIRSINNDDRIRRNIATVADLIEKSNLEKAEPISQKKATKQLIAVIDGGHLKSSAEYGNSFEAMISTVFCPDNIIQIDKNHKEITKKTSVASALDDKQKTIKKLISNACLKEGAHPEITEITCLTDGAANCWSITNSLKPLCKELINILDWFHITKRFTIINNHIDDGFKERLEKVKWFLWHGKSNNALQRLKKMTAIVSDEKLLSELKELAGYIDRNKKYMVNYQERFINDLPFTSTYAESSVNAIINTRQKNDKKMQWTREGAHHVLQIRTSLFSKTWQSDWQLAQQGIYKQAA